MQFWEKWKALSVDYYICMKEIIILLVCIGSICLITTICAKVIKNRFMEKITIFVYIVAIIVACAGALYIALITLGIRNILKLLLNEIVGWILIIPILVILCWKKD